MEGDNPMRKGVTVRGQWEHWKERFRDFPGGPVVKTSPSNTGGAGSIPGWGAKVSHALRPKNQEHKTEAIL